MFKPLLSSLLIIFSLSACSLFDDDLPVVVAQNTPQAIAPSVQPIEMKPVGWVVYNKDDLIKLLDALSKNPQIDFVIFALDPTNFQNLNLNIQEMKRFVEEQKAIIDFYVRVQEQNHQKDDKTP